MYLRKRPVSCLLIFSLFIAGAGAKTNDDNLNLADSLNKIGQVILSVKTDDKTRINQLNVFQNLILTALKNRPFTDEFDSVKVMALLKSRDGMLRIYNWECRWNDGTYEYYGIVVATNKEKQPVITALTDQSEKVKNPERTLLQASSWYGAHYYKLIESGNGKNKYFTLLGADFNNKVSRKKLVEILRVQPDGCPLFGAPVIQYEDKLLHRLIFEYSAQVSMSLQYVEKKNSIIFDHLSPIEPGLTDQKAFYAPDLSFDALRYKRKKWKHYRDVDARNEK